MQVAYTSLAVPVMEACPVNTREGRTISAERELPQVALERKLQ